MSKKKVFRSKYPVIFIVVIATFFVYAGWSLYSMYLLKSIPAVQVSSNPVKYNIGNRPHLTAPIEIKTVNASSGWDRSDMPKYGFSIQHPSNSTITQDEGTTFQYVRIQNYDGKNMSPGDRLSRGKYFLEILVFDHKIGHDISKETSCKDRIENPQVVTVDGIKGYKGLIQGGDATEIILAFCISKPDVDYYIKAYEDEPEVAEGIISSFKFTN